MLNGFLPALLVSRAQKYSAPDVLVANGARNRKSDVFSLGCVFVDIISTLSNQPTASRV